MMKKLKIFYIGLFVFAFLPLLALATNNVSVQAGLSILLPADSSSYTVGTATNVQSFTVNNTTIDFVLEASSIISLTSADRKEFNVYGISSQCDVSEVCGASSSILTIQCPSNAAEQNITLTPSGTCTMEQSGSGSPGGGGPSYTPPPATEEEEEVETEEEETKEEIEAIQNFVISIPTQVSIGSSSHTVTVSSATEAEATITVESEPITLDLTKDEAQDVDTDADGVNDLRVTYLGLSNGEPQLKFEELVVAEETTQEEEAGTCALSKKAAYKHSASPAVYYITEDCTKRAFTNPTIFMTYFDSWGDVQSTSKTSLDAIANDALGFMPYGPKYDPKYGALVKIVSDPKVYLLLGTERYWIASETVFNALKYSWNWIEDVAVDLLNEYTEGSEITDLAKHPNYTLIKYDNDPKVYRLENGMKRHIANEAAFNELNFRWDRIVTVDDTETYPDGEQME